MHKLAPTAGLLRQGIHGHEETVSRISMLLAEIDQFDTDVVDRGILLPFGEIRRRAVVLPLARCSSFD
jgi:hypothetical protein